MGKIHEDEQLHPGFALQNLHGEGRKQTRLLYMALAKVRRSASDDSNDVPGYGEELMQMVER